MSRRGLEGELASLRGARWALYGALAAPLVWVPGFAFPWSMPGTAWARVCVAAGAVCAAWAVASGRARLRRPSDPFTAALLLALAVAAASAFTGVAPSHSLFGNLERMGGVVGIVHLVTWYLVLRAVLDDGGWRRALRALVVVGALAALVAIGQWLHGFQETAIRFRSHAPLENAGPLGIFMVLSVCAAAASTADPEADTVWRRTATAAGTLALAGLAASGTRSAVAGLGLGALAGGFVWLFRTGDARLRRLVPWAAGVGLMALLALGVLGIRVAGVPATGSEAERDGRAGRVQDRALGMRVVALEAAVGAVKDRPLTGWGPENFRVAFDRHAGPRRPELETRAISYDRAHDFFAEAAVAGGIPGLFVALALAVAALWVLAGAALSPSAMAPGEAAAVTAGVVAYGAYLLFWYQVPATAAAALLLVGFAAHRREGGRLLEEGSSPEGEGSGPVRAAATVIALLTAAVAVHAVLLLRPARAIVQATGVDDAGAKFGAYERALEAGVPGAEEAVARYAEDLASLFPRARELAGNESARAVLGPAFASARSALDDQIRGDPENARLRALRSGLLVTEARWRGDRELAEDAVEAMAEAVQRAPAQLVYRYTLSDLLRITDRRDASIRVLRRAMEIAPGVDETRLQLARAFVQAGEPDSAADHLLRGKSAVGSPADTVLIRRLLADLAGRDEHVPGLRDLLAETRSTLRAAEGEE